MYHEEHAVWLKSFSDVEDISIALEDEPYICGRVSRRSIDGSVD